MTSGVYKGRLAALYADAPNSMMLTYADFPYQSWSEPVQVASDLHDSPFSACIDAAGNIYVAYADSNQVLIAIKLNFASGHWNVVQSAVICEVDWSSRPVIIKDSTGCLWCLFDHHWTSYNSRHTIRAKSSIDDGVSWGEGTTDIGTALSAAWVDQGYVGVCQDSSRIYAVYCVGHSNLLMRTCDLSRQLWNDEMPIAVLDIVDDNFHAAVSGNGKVGVVFAHVSGQKICLKEYDGLLWGGLVTVENVEGLSPQIIYKDDVPHIFFSRDLGNGYYMPRYARKSGTVFTLESLSPSMGNLDKVYVYCASGSPQYQDKTAAASNVTAGDIFHSSSQGLLDSVGDCLYLGKQSKFFCAAVILSTAGSGGNVAWEYFNGVAWTQFTPFSGAYNFDAPDTLVYLWQDAAAISPDWQACPVNGVTMFWVRARVTNGYIVNPVGTQLLAAARIADLALAEEGV